MGASDLVARRRVCQRMILLAPRLYSELPATDKSTAFGAIGWTLQATRRYAAIDGFRELRVFDEANGFAREVRKAFPTPRNMDSTVEHLEDKRVLVRPFD